MAQIDRVVLVGHCGADQFMLTQAVGRVLGDRVAIDSANSVNQLEGFISSRSLLLINRQLGWRFPTRSGVELIQSLASRSNPPVIMLISNYADAQQQAVGAGAHGGFGKSDLNSSMVSDLLLRVVGQPDSLT